MPTRRQGRTPAALTGRTGGLKSPALRSESPLGSASVWSDPPNPARSQPGRQALGARPDPARSRPGPKHRLQQCLLFLFLWCLSWCLSRLCCGWCCGSVAAVFRSGGAAPACVLNTHPGALFQLSPGASMPGGLPSESPVCLAVFSARLPLGEMALAQAEGQLEGPGFGTKIGGRRGASVRLPPKCAARTGKGVASESVSNVLAPVGALESALLGLVPVCAFPF